MKRAAALLSSLAAVALPTPALACSINLSKDYAGSKRQLDNVRRDLQQASAIIDGEVVRAWTSNRPALIRVHHVLKGNLPPYVQVGGNGAGADCSLALEEVGERLRMILNGGPEVFDLFRDGSEARLEDRLLRSDRRKVWPYRPGAAVRDEGRLR